MATADGHVKVLQNAMKMAKEAIQLDGSNRHKEAYCEYLRTISYISQTLLEEAASHEEWDMVAVEVERMLRLAEQCLERAKSFIGKSFHLPDSPDFPASASSSASPALPGPPQTVESASVAPVAVDHRASSPIKTGHHGVLSDGGGKPCPFLPPEVFQRLQTVTSQDVSRKGLTPIEEASQLNEKLKANYEARLARLAPGQAYQKTSLTLSLQRQMMENLIIAKARQDALQRKMEERRLRLQEEANRRFSACGALTAEEQEQRMLYTNVLEYEQDHDWPKQWKAHLKNNPDVMMVSDLITYLLRQSDHPVVKLLKRHQYRIYNRLYPIVSKGLPYSPVTLPRSSHSSVNLQDLDDNSFNMDSSLSVSHSHNIDTKCDPEETVDLENSFGDLELLVNQKDWAPPCDDTDNPSIDPELSCEPSIQLEQGESHVQELEMRALREHLKATVKDIHGAIDQLLLLCLLSFECLNTARFKDLCLASIEEAFFTPLWSTLVALFSGADDLLPILSFVVLCCQCPQLVSECAALEEFIHEGYLIGEEGYCLTSMQSALAYVESLHTGGAQLPIGGPV
ncbi:VPS9 domain-containing protein 1 isoform 2-T2 [Pholidichthys leucotaenia]